MPCINLHYALSWYLTMWRNATLAKIFEMCTSCNDIKILLRSFTCWYLTIWWIATITIIQTCNVKFENECQALTSYSERYIMMGIMMGVLISSNNLNYQYVSWILRSWIQGWLISTMAYRQGELRITPLSIDCHHQKGGDCWISDFDDEVNCHLLSNLCVEISVQD